MRRFFRFIIFKWWVAKVERKALSPEFESRDGEVFSCSSLLKKQLENKWEHLVEMNVRILKFWMKF